jgi:phage tail-like protein
MSCGPQPATFRLLDGLVGWDVASAVQLAGVGDESGIRLSEAVPGAVDPQGLLPYLPPPRLAPACGPCGWFLAADGGRLLLRDGCSDRFAPVHGAAGSSAGPWFLATWKRRVAIADAVAGRVRIFAGEGTRLIGQFDGGAGPIAFLASGELLVALPGAARLLRVDPSGASLGDEGPSLPSSGAVDRLRVGADGTLWIVLRGAAGELSLWRALPGGALLSASVGDLSFAFSPSTLCAASDRGFALCEGSDGGSPVRRRCFRWDGAAVDSIDPIAVAAPWVHQGQLLTAPVDSGMPRCRWHRVRIEASVPPGCRVSVAVCASESPAPPDQGSQASETGWSTFPAGLPHPGDWSSGPPGALDFLIDQPAGRYLFVRIRLSGDGTTTPVVRRVRLDFPRSTSLERLPGVFREDVTAADFTERFLALFDASIEDLDRAIERAPALLDAAGVPDEVLPWLGSFLDLAFEGSWTPAQRRAILRAAPSLYRRRGTVAALKEAIALVFGVEPLVEELALQPGFRALGRDARTGGVRLFSRRKSRFLLNRSLLGQSPLRSYGSPDRDPDQQAAFRIRVVLPAGAPGRPTPERLQRFVESQKPAHTLADVSVATGAWLVGRASALGVETLLGSAPPPVVGKSVRLRRDTILWPSSRRDRGSFRVGQSAVGQLAVV